MNEQEEVGVNIKFENGSDMNFNRRTMALHTHFGKLAVYDHIRLKKPDQQTLLVFEGGAHHLYKPLLEFILRNDYPMYMNKVEVEDIVKEQLLSSQAKKMGDTIPDDWDAK